MITWLTFKASNHAILCKAGSRSYIWSLIMLNLLFLKSKSHWEVEVKLMNINTKSTFSRIWMPFYHLHFCFFSRCFHLLGAWAVYWLLCNLIVMWFDLLQGDPQDPVAYDNGVTYMFIQHNNVYLMTASRQNCNAASLLLFLHRVVDVSSADIWGCVLYMC